MEYILHLLILISLYIILAQSLSLVSGYSGMLSLAHAGFYGIGAYIAAILSLNYNFSFLVILPVSMLICGIVAIFFAFISLRTVEDYFVITTLGIQVIVFSMMNNCQSLTNGPLGIANIPKLSFLGLTIDGKFPFLLTSIFIVLIIWFLLNNLCGSPFGRILIALSVDEIFTQSLGKNVMKSKIIAFTTSAMFASVAGVLFAFYNRSIEPGNFSIDESILILSMVIIGGLRNMSRIAIIVIILVLLPEALRFLGIPNSIAANMHQIIYGSILIFVIFNENIKLNKTQKLSN